MLELKHPSGLVVVGVHSAKFDNEKSEVQLEHAINRYNIEHPVYNDKSLHLWNTLGVTCWPTLLVLSPAGVPIHVLMGEGHSDFLEEYVSAALTYFKETGELVGGRIPRSLHSKAGGSTLKYPGKLAVFDQFLVVSDSGNNRILFVEISGGKVLHVVGSGSRGRRDGGFKEASFNNPQGLCGMGKDTVLVADTDNHLIRLINLKTASVSTVGGTGSQGMDKEGGRQGSEQEISSPWDVCRLSESAVAIAMAGTHQIWMFCLDDVNWWKGAKYAAGTLVRIAGSGEEENRNNSYPSKAGFAQPSGLALDASAGMLFIADSESSTIRRMDLKDGCIKNVCGGERDPMNLFAFGDRDGKGVDAKLQHPLAVAWNSVRSEMYIADSYNHKIRKVAGTKNETTTLIGSGPGNSLGDSSTARLCEPGGLCTSEDGTKLYIADTNNHAVRVLDLDTLVLSAVDIQFSGISEVYDSIMQHRVETGQFCGSLQLTGSLDHPEFKLNLEAPSTWSLETPPAEAGWSFPGGLSGEMGPGQLRIQIVGSTAQPASSTAQPANSTAQPARIHLNLKLYLCTKSSGVCLARKVQHQIEILPVAGSTTIDTVDLGPLLSL